MPNMSTVFIITYTYIKLDVIMVIVENESVMNGVPLSRLRYADSVAERVSQQSVIQYVPRPRLRS